MCNKGEKEKMGKWRKEELTIKVILRISFSNSPYSPFLLLFILYENCYISI
jgi:hypothetical protein